MRETLDFSRGWLLSAKKGEEKYADSEVTLPFICSAESVSSLVLSNSLKITESDEGKDLYLEFSALSGKAQLYVNDEKTGECEASEQPFTIPLTQNAQPGKSYELRLEIKPSSRSDGRFICGKTELLSLNRSHFSLEYPGCGIFVTSELKNDCAELHIKAKITNPNNYDVVSFSVENSAGDTLAVKTEKPTSAETLLTIEKPRLWGGQGDVHIYTLKASLQRDSAVLDSLQTQFGIRLLDAAPGGLFRINSIPLPLNGVKLSDCAAVKKDLKLLSLLEANSLIVSCLPAKTDLLAECDRSGTLLWYQASFTGDGHDIDRLKSFLLYNYNHPSLAAVICPENADGEYTELFAQTVKENSAGVFSAFICKNEPEIKIPPGFDIALLKLILKKKGGFASEALGRFENIKNSYADMKIAVLAEAPAALPEKSALQLHESLWNAFFREKGVSAYFAGPLSDSSLEGGLSGLCLENREELKDVFWFYKTQFSAREFAKLCTLEKSSSSKKTDIRCYSNVKPLLLYVNGKHRKKYTPVEIYSGVYLFGKIKLKRKNNIIELSAGSQRDTKEIYRGKSDNNGL